MKDEPTPNVRVPKECNKWDANDELAIQNNAKVKKILIYGIGSDEYNRVSACQDAKVIWDTLQIAHEESFQVNSLSKIIPTGKAIRKLLNILPES